MKKLSLVTTLVLSLFAQSALATNTQQWLFDVYLDTRKIGWHRFTTADLEQSFTVESIAEFDVKIAFINFFSYRHRNNETWQNGCLATIASTTDDNGDDYKVDGEQRTDGFAVTTLEEQVMMPECIMTYAYWKKDFLSQDKLLNSQTGELEDVVISMVGEDTYSFNGADLAADHYQIDTKNGVVNLWYEQETERWLALESMTKDGNTIRYLPASLPATSAKELAQQ